MSFSLARAPMARQSIARWHNRNRFPQRKCLRNRFTGASFSAVHASFHGRFAQRHAMVAGRDKLSNMPRKKATTEKAFKDIRALSLTVRRNIYELEKRVHHCCSDKKRTSREKREACEQLVRLSAASTLHISECRQISLHLLCKIVMPTDFNVPLRSKRMGGDSNPRCLSAHTLSRRAQ
jgi:hypothetical protein